MITPQPSLEISYPRSLRQSWPDPLAADWLAEYPQLFDTDDLRITRDPHQGRYHFREWYTAIHLFKTHGALSLIEKYLYQTHPRKLGVLSAELTPLQLKALAGLFALRGCWVGEEGSAQPPDLFVYVPGVQFWFAEVKRVGESTSPAQVASQAALALEFGVPIQ